MVILFSTKFHLYLKICKVLFTLTATFSFLLSTALSKLNVIGFFYKKFIALYPFSRKVLKKKLTIVLISCFSQEMQLETDKNFFYGSIKILYFLAAGDFKNILHNLKIF